MVSASHFLRSRRLCCLGFCMAFHSLPCPGRRSLYGIVDQIVIRGSHLEQTVADSSP